MSKARELANLGNAYSDGALSNRSLIVNGAMTIDQRNGGSAVNNANSYTLDRWYFMQGQASNTVAHNVEQSSTAPADFLNSLKITVATAADPSTSNYTSLFHRVEGYNSAQLNYGLSTASTSTLSFWVYSSVTGTFGVALQNSAATRSYVGTYTINASNTWEQKTISIQGDTSGTWVKNNGIGLGIYWDIGVGTAQSTTAGTWQSGNYLGLTGGAKLCQTSGATFYLTGVQLEVGDTATPFEHRSYGDELARCQRYYYQRDYTINNYEPIKFPCWSGSTSTLVGEWKLPVTMRASPTVTNNGVGNFRLNDSRGNDQVCTSINITGSNIHEVWLTLGGANSTFTVGYSGYINTQSTNDAALYFDAEL